MTGRSIDCLARSLRRAFHSAVASFVVLVLTSSPLRSQCPDGTPPPCARVASRAAPPPNSVAVLTFENLSRDTSDDYLADGLTEDMTAKLGQVSRLAVTSRAAVRRLRAASSLSTADIGRSLGARYLVTGSIQRAGTRLRISAELVRAATGARVWGEQYDRPAADLLAIQAEIADAVASGIAGRLLPEERTRLAARPTGSPEAYDHYLRGNRLSAAGTVAASVIGAIAEYEAALRVDPSFTAARGRLAMTYGLALNWDVRPNGMTAESVAARAALEADRALREDSLNSAAWTARGFIMFLRGRATEIQASVASFRRAVELNPGDYLARGYLGGALRRMGHFAEAEHEYHAALLLNPAYPAVISEVGVVAFSQRRYSQARLWLDSALVLDSMAYNLLSLRARVRIEQGDTSGALEDSHRVLGLAGPDDQLRLAAARAEIEARAGLLTDARQRLQRVYERLEWPGGRPPSAVSVRLAYEVALAAVAAGDRDIGLTILERASPRGPWLWSYLVFPGFDAIRQEPRFQQVYHDARPAGAEPLPGVDP